MRSPSSASQTISPGVPSSAVHQASQIVTCLSRGRSLAWFARVDVGMCFIGFTVIVLSMFGWITHSK